jgi:hypothetical protein
MLELRPNCEHCNKALPANSAEAMICSFECTFCQQCVELLENVCPNCGGGFTRRPVRPHAKLSKYPASTSIKHKPVDLEAHRAFAASIKTISPPDR